MNFKKFIDTQDQAFASILQGQLKFNKSAMRQFSIEEYSHCCFYYDKGKDILGIELTNTEDIYTVKIRNETIHVRSIFKANNLKVSTKTTRCNLKQDPKTKLLYIHVRKLKNG